MRKVKGQTGFVRETDKVYQDYSLDPCKTLRRMCTTICWKEKRPRANPFLENRLRYRKKGRDKSHDPIGETDRCAINYS
jgi:hypothetical protein